VAYLPEDSPFVHGLGIFSLAGFGVDYPGSTGNPLFTAPPSAGLGFGPVRSEFQALLIVPALTYRATNRLPVAAGPTLTLATLRVEPGLFAAPDDANGDGFATYPAATHARTVVGGGFTVGVYYQADGWAVEASLKSPSGWTPSASTPGTSRGSRGTSRSTSTYPRSSRSAALTPGWKAGRSASTSVTSTSRTSTASRTRALYGMM
jgi:hypothetical protein